MNEDYVRQLDLLTMARDQKLISQLDYLRIYEMLLDSDGEDYFVLEVINDDLIATMESHKKQILCDRLVIGSEKIEATDDPKEKARLMVHYNNLLKELTA
jgi:hypothetical protein